MIKCYSFIYQERERYKLGDPSTFHYLNQSNCIKLEGLDESKEYLETRKAMDIIGISSEEQVHILLMSGIIFPLNQLELALDHMVVFHLGSNLSGCCCYSPFGEY